MKTTLLTYGGLALFGAGVLLAKASDPDLLLFAVPMGIAGLVLFIENLKQAIADAVAVELSSRR